MAEGWYLFIYLLATPRCLWDLNSQPGTELVLPALEGRVLTTGPLRNTFFFFFKLENNCFCFAFWCSSLEFYLLKWPLGVAEPNSPSPLGFTHHLAEECSLFADSLVVFGIQVLILCRTLRGSWAQKLFSVPHFLNTGNRLHLTSKAFPKFQPGGSNRC